MAHRTTLPFSFTYDTPLDLFHNIDTAPEMSNEPIICRRLASYNNLHGHRDEHIALNTCDDCHQNVAIIEHNEITKYLVHDRHSSIIYSGASHSAVRHFIKLRHPSRQQHSIELAFGRTHSEGKGHGDIPNTIYLRNCPCDIYSVSSLNNLGYEILFNRSDNVYTSKPAQGMDVFERMHRHRSSKTWRRLDHSHFC